MQKLLRPLLAVLFVLAIIAFAFSFTVRFTESAVVTTFGKAGENAVLTEPGLKFKWPYPIQSVTKYDTRLRVLQTRSQTQQTAEDSQVIVEAFATWRVSNPLVFFQAFSNAGSTSEDHYAQAEEILKNILRSALSQTSKYRLDELFSAEPGASKFAELEQRVFDDVVDKGESGSEKGLADYGIEVAMVGINRVVLPEKTTESVIKRMGAVRDNLARSIGSQGDARAEAIRATAKANADKIRAFTRRRAAEIEAKGEIEAAEYLAMQADEPGLAVFLQNIEMMRNAMAKRMTLILSASDFGMGLFSPTALDGLGEGEIPSQLPADSALLNGQAARGSVISGAFEDGAAGGNP